MEHCGQKQRKSELVGSSAEKCSAELTACEVTRFRLLDGPRNPRKFLTLEALELYGHSICERALWSNHKLLNSVSAAWSGLSLTGRGLPGGRLSRTFSCWGAPGDAAQQGKDLEGTGLSSLEEPGGCVLQTAKLKVGYRFPWRNTRPKQH